MQLDSLVVEWHGRSDAIAHARDDHRCAELAISLHLVEALYRTRTDDPFLTMEVLYQLS